MYRTVGSSNRKSAPNKFLPAELKILSRLNTPGRIQQFLDSEIGYNVEATGETCRSPRRVMRDRVAQCMEGALFAAAALRHLGLPPLILDLESVRDDDHVLAVFRIRGLWGAIAKSNYSGLRFRDPVYRNLRELVMSYFEGYYNDDGEKTLRRYSGAINLARFDSINWMTSEQDLWEIPDYLQVVSHRDLMPRGMERHLTRVDERSFLAGKLGAARKPGHPH